jgi:hypothetical protein
MVANAIWRDSPVRVEKSANPEIAHQSSPSNRVDVQSRRVNLAFRVEDRLHLPHG